MYRYTVRLEFQACSPETLCWSKTPPVTCPTRDPASAISNWNWQRPRETRRIEQSWLCSRTLGHPLVPLSSYGEAQSDPDRGSASGKTVSYAPERPDPRRSAWTWMEPSSAHAPPLNPVEPCAAGAVQPRAVSGFPLPVLDGRSDPFPGSPCRASICHCVMWTFSAVRPYGKTLAARLPSAASHPRCVSICKMAPLGRNVVDFIQLPSVP